MHRTSALMVFVTISGGDRDPMYEKGFRLPDGDPDLEREVFLIHRAPITAADAWWP